MSINCSSPPWACLVEVDVAPMVAWLAEGPSLPWSDPPSADKPHRVFIVPGRLSQPIIDAVIEEVQGDVIAHRPMLSRMRPGQQHGMHHDLPWSGHLTRVHVPLATNPGAWMQWEDGERVHFCAGKAYTFDIERRHAFGNDGDTDRIHLIFDVLER